MTQMKQKGSEKGGQENVLVPSQADDASITEIMTQFKEQDKEVDAETASKAGGEEPASSCS